MDSTILQPPGDYPDDWLRVDFDHFATLQRGKDLTRDHFCNGEVPVAGSNGIIGYHDVANVKAPGITVGRSGSVGKVTFYREDFWAHNTALFVKDFHRNVPEFTAFFLDFLRLGRFGSGASVPTLDRNVFRTLPIVVPSPCEQGKIAAVLGLVQRAIEQQERLIALTTELKKALLHKLFTEGLRGEPQKQTEIGPVPESWAIHSVGDIAYVKGGKRLPKNHTFADGSTPFPYIRVTDFSEFGVDTSDLKYLRPETQTLIRRYTISVSDVYISIAGSIGMTGMIPANLDGANLTENAAKLVIRTPSVSPRFLMYFLGSDAAQREMRSQTVKNAQPKLALVRIASLNVPIPVTDEQRDIVAVLDTLSQKQQTLAKKKKSLESLFRTLLHQLMTAQIRVNDLDLDGVVSDGGAEAA
jgi:type I restriction enzyme S subunit